MKTATVTSFRSNMKKHLEQIESDQDILILLGPKKKDYVLLTLKDFNAMEETAHLLSTPANAAQLSESIEQHKAGNITSKQLVYAKKKSQKRKLAPKE